MRRVCRLLAMRFSLRNRASTAVLRRVMVDRYSSYSSTRASFPRVRPGYDSSMVGRADVRDLHPNPHGQLRSSSQASTLRTSAHQVVVSGGWGDGTCRHCRSGNSQICAHGRWIGSGPYGGYAGFVPVAGRDLIKVDKRLIPEELAPLTDAGKSTADVRKELNSATGRGEPAPRLECMARLACTLGSERDSAGSGGRGGCRCWSRGDSSALALTN